MPTAHVAFSALIVILPAHCFRGPVILTDSNDSPVAFSCEQMAYFCDLSNNSMRKGHCDYPPGEGNPGSKQLGEGHTAGKWHS